MGLLLKRRILCSPRLSGCVNKGGDGDVVLNMHSICLIFAPAKGTANTGDVRKVWAQLMCRLLGCGPQAAEQLDGSGGWGRCAAVPRRCLVAAGGAVAPQQQRGWCGLIGHQPAVGPWCAAGRRPRARDRPGVQSLHRSHGQGRACSPAVTL